MAALPSLIVLSRFYWDVLITNLDKSEFSAVHTKDVSKEFGIDVDIVALGIATGRLRLVTNI